jgi:hypothetical protein
MVDTSRSRFNKSLNTRQTANLLLNEKFFRSRQAKYSARKPESVKGAFMEAAPLFD